MIVMPLQAARVTLTRSEPTALVQETDSKLQILWQMPVLNANGTLKAKFQINPMQAAAGSLDKFYQPIYAKFHVDNETLSQVKFDILSSNYKLSLLKEKIESGKYFCNHDQQTVVAPEQVAKKPPFLAGTLSTSIGSTVDLLLNH